MKGQENSRKSILSTNLLMSEALSNPLSFIKNLLLTPALQRTQKQIEALMHFSKDIKFFLNLIEDNGEEIHYQACQYIGYEIVKQGDVIYN